jgi:PAS domain S-box-containing protein
MNMEKDNHAVLGNKYKYGFNLLFDQVEDYLLILDEAGRILRANKAVLEKLGYTLEEMINLNVELLCPLIRRGEIPAKVNGIREGDLCKWLMPLRGKSGELIPLEMRGFKGTWEGENVLYGIGKEVLDYEGDLLLTNDITDRKPKKGDQKLKHIQSVLDSLPFLAWMKDKGGRYIIVNRAFEGFYRIKNLEIAGKTDFDIFPYKIALKHKESEEELIKSKQRLLEPLHHEVAGKWLETFVVPYFEEKGEVVGTIGVAKNITERKQLEIELANQKRFLKTMLDTIPDYILYKNLIGAYLGCNKAYAEKYLGVNEDEVRGKTDFDLMKDIELAKFYRQKDQEALQAIDTLKYEGQYTLTDGQVIDIETVKTPFLDEQGNVAGLIGVARDITERKMMEKRLREQAEYAELLFRTVPIAVLSVDRHRKITRWNKIAEEITGYTAAEVMNKECSMVLHGVSIEGCELCRNAMDAPLINEKCKIITKDGQIKHVLKSIAILKDEFGEINEKMECFEDVTEMINLEAELRESRERYAAIVNNAPQIVVIFKQGVVEFVNDTGIGVLGYKEDECLGRQMKDFMTGDSLACVNAALINGMNGEQCISSEIELITKSGQIINVLLKGTDITYEREKAFLAIMMDITESKQLNAKLRASEEKFRQLAETINEIFLITDNERVLYVSPAYERITGVVSQTFLDDPQALVELIYPIDRKSMRSSLPQDLLNINKATNEEFRIIRPDGETRWLWLQSYPLRDEANESSLKATSIVDITDRKKIEDKLWERERQTQMELLLAARVQQDSLPHPLDEDKVRVRTIFKPYSTVSGDLFNYKWLEGRNKLCGYIVDVSGHGVATALQTATFKMMLDNVLLTGETVEKGALQTINQRIMNYLYEDSFVALLYFEFDLRAAELTLISAGITLFLVAKLDECSLVPITGCYLGMIDDPEIERVTMPLKAGEIYVMMSDGASDLIELHGIRKQEGFTEYKSWLEKLAESPERNDDFSAICIEIFPENKITNLLDIKTEEDLIHAQLMISEFLEQNAPNHTLLLEVAVNEAMNNGFDSGGRIRVKTRRMGGNLIIRVKDDGPGFDTNRLNCRFKEELYENDFEELLESEGGRGIFLMRLFCDKVIYNAKGNEVLLMKKIN